MVIYLFLKCQEQKWSSNIVSELYWQSDIGKYEASQFIFLLQFKNIVTTVNQQFIPVVFSLIFIWFWSLLGSDEKLSLSIFTEILDFGSNSLQQVSQFLILTQKFCTIMTFHMIILGISSKFLVDMNFALTFATGSITTQV